MTIYFIQEGTERALIKIGFTKTKPSQRLASVQTGSPDKLYLLGTMDGDEIKEEQIHTKFKDINYRGEWFYPSKELLAFVKKNTKPPKIKTRAEKGSLGYFFYQKRQELGISQDTVSQALGYAHRSEIHRLETGRLEFRLKHLFVLAELFGMKASELLAEYERAMGRGD